MKRIKEGFIQGIKKTVEYSFNVRHEPLPGKIRRIFRSIFRKETIESQEMSDCNCNQNNVQSNSNAEHVPNFAVAGFDGEHTANFDAIASAFEGVDAAQIKACVSATYDPATKKLCFKLPIIGHFCITLPIPVPFGADLKVCAQTCGIIPRGAKITVYLNGHAIYSTTVGKC
ncbi:hypothetical protein [Acidovorax sp. SUPP3334]|uniref:hypothetical protein n=1 Tax=Acidovorax sp. SUPP3334 TaxID=2920881 RepID=UPI0024E0B883|nr:hypothetical protein [Acidovorax sp. SUPP3334]